MPMKTRPYKHQMAELKAHARKSARALLWQMRTGKSKVIIDTACKLSGEGQFDTVIILAPNGVHRNWVERELAAHHWENVPYSALIWDTKAAMARPKEGFTRNEFWTEAKRLVEKPGLVWFAFASETVTRDDARRLLRWIVAKRRARMLVVDESDDYGRAGSKKTKLARSLAKQCVYRRILSGTAVENSPLRAWSQFELLEPGALGFKTFAEFESQYAVYEMNGTGRRMFKRLVGYQNLEDLRRRMAKFASVVTRDECEDLPPLVRSERTFSLSSSERKFYNAVKNDIETELAGGALLSAAEGGARLIRLQQVSSGWITDEVGRVTIIGRSRLEALREEIESTGPNTRHLIWCAFRREMDAVQALLADMGRKALTYHGRSTEEEKRRVRIEFSPGAISDYTDIIGHPKAGGRGLNLSGADKIIWFSHTFDAILRAQADERASQFGGRAVPVVDLIAQPGIDSYILRIVREKRSVAEMLARSGLREFLRAAA